MKIDKYFLSLAGEYRVCSEQHESQWEKIVAYCDAAI